MSEAAKVAASGRPGTFGMAVFVASDAATFTALLVTHAVLRGRAQSWGEGEPALSAGFGAGLTALLLGSSAAVELARRRERPRSRAFALAAAAGLGFLFCAGQLYEWIALRGQGLALDRSPRASSFFLLTGFHGLHVAAGALAMFALLAARRSHSAALGPLALYWHFIAAIWLLIYASAYLV